MPVQTATNDASYNLVNFDDEILLSIFLNGGNVLVQGKATVFNQDYVKGGVKLRLTYREEVVELDVGDVMLAGGTGTTINLIGWITGAAAGDIVVLRGGAKRATADHARLTAMQVDQFV